MLHVERAIFSERTPSADHSAASAGRGDPTAAEPTMSPISVELSISSDTATLLFFVQLLDLAKDPRLSKAVHHQRPVVPEPLSRPRELERVAVGGDDPEVQDDLLLPATAEGVVEQHRR